MASIPLPELSIRPPEQTDILGQYGKAVALKSMLQQQQYQQQMQPLQLQQEQLQVQTAQRQMASQKALQQALIDDPTADPDELTQQAIKKGAFPADVLPLANQLKESRLKTLQMRGENLKNAQTANDVVGRNAQMLLGIQDEQQRQQAYESYTIPALKQLGLPAEQIPQQVPDDTTLRAHAAAATNGEQWLKEAREQQQHEQQHGIIDPARYQEMQGLLNNFAANNKDDPAKYQLPPQGQATWDDYNRMDKIMEHTEKNVSNL